MGVEATIQPYAKWVVLGVIILLLAYEGYAVFNHKSNDSISAVVWHGVQGSLMIPFLGGLLCGHFFMSSGKNAIISFLIGLAGGSFAWKKGDGGHL